MALRSPTASQIRAAKRNAVGGRRKRCRRGKNCSAACIQSGMVCLVELPEPMSVAVSKVSKALVSRGRSLPSDLKRELAALGGPGKQLLTGKALIDAVREEKANNPSAGGLSLAKILGFDDPKKFYDALVDAKARQSDQPLPSAISARAKTVDKSIEPNSQSLKKRVKDFIGRSETPDDNTNWTANPPLNQLREELRGYLSVLKEESPSNLGMSKREFDSFLKEGGALQKEVSGFLTNQRAYEAAQTASGGTRYARGDAKDFDGDLVSGKLRRVGDSNYLGWNDSYGSGAKAVGEGSYGSVIKNKDGTYVKRGAISDTEADLIKELGKKDIGPRLIAADVNGKHSWHNENFVDIRNGRIAMTGVAGAPMGEVYPTTKFAGKQAADVYWKALGDLHRLGIAHNDAHIENILVDNKGKGRWVDLGLAQKSPKAALAEALGSFTGRGSGEKEGNWQTRRWDATGVRDWENSQSSKSSSKNFKGEYPVLGQVAENRAKVFSQLREYGLTGSDYALMVETPIRSPLSVYGQGPWAKLSDAQAQNLINTLYDGI